MERTIAHADVSASQQEPGEEVLQMNGVSAVSLQNPHAVSVADIDWRTRAGEVWIIGGLPASGKSDFLTTAAGLLRPAQGQLRLFGRDLADMSEDELVEVRRKVGFVFSYGARLFHGLTVAENVALPFRYHHNLGSEPARQRVRSILELTDLNDVATTRPERLPRSMHHRIGLARALVLSPSVLLLDNPFAGMDPRQTRWWLDFLDALRGGHPLLHNGPLTIIVATDDLRPWRQSGQHFGILDGGRFSVIGSRDDLEGHSHPVLRELLSPHYLPG